MKTENRDFKPWANDSEVRQSYENSILYGYYALYGCMILFLFFIIPFIYFYYEESDEEMFTRGSRVCIAFRYTIFFILMIGTLLVVGAFIPLKEPPPPQNSSNWEKMEFLFSEVGKNKGEDALSFVLSVLSLIGMVILIINTGYGISALPFSLVRGFQNIQFEHEECANRQITVQAKINAIKDKYRNGRLMASHDRRAMEALQEEERLMERQLNYLDTERHSWFNKCSCVIRPFEIVLGIFFGLLGLIIFISLLLSSIDKAMHSFGYTVGYVLPKSYLPNPIDIIFVYVQQVFPLDYLLYFGIVMFFIFCSMSGIRQLGIWFLWVRMFRIRPHRTRPQGLLLLTVTLMFIIMALHVTLYSLTPQYTTYGSQHYMPNITNSTPVECNTEAPAGECIMSRISLLLTRYFYKAWFFGACYYYGIWIFLVAIIVGALVSILRKPQSSLVGAAMKDDFEESDDELLTG